MVKDGDEIWNTGIPIQSLWLIKEKLHQGNSSTFRDENVTNCKSSLSSSSSKHLVLQIKKMLTAVCVLSFLAISVLTPSVSGAYCHGSPAAGERVNDMPIVDEKLTHIRSVKNAMLFEAGPANARFPVVHVWGTPYEVGFAQGTVRKEAIIQFVAQVWEYLVTGLTPYITNDRIPQILKDAIISKTLDRALDWSRKVTEDFTPQDYKDELRGIADATGIDYDMLYR